MKPSQQAWLKSYLHRRGTMRKAAETAVHSMSACKTPLDLFYCLNTFKRFRYYNTPRYNEYLHKQG